MHASLKRSRLITGLAAAGLASSLIFGGTAAGAVQSPPRGHPKPTEKQLVAAGYDCTAFNRSGSQSICTKSGSPDFYCDEGANCTPDTTKTAPGGSPRTTPPPIRARVTI